MKLSEIKQTIGTVATVTGDDDVEIRYLLTDSRQLNVQRDDVQCTKNNDVQSTKNNDVRSTKAAQTLFFALKTEKNDGAKYIPELEKKGVRAFVTGDALAALQLLAAHVRSRFNGTVIGITGSNGKTVVKEWLYQLLKEDYTIIRSPKSYNSQIGVPLSVWQLADADRLADCKTASKSDSDRSAERSASPERPLLAIFEAGISQPGEMEKL